LNSILNRRVEVEKPVANFLSEMIRIPSVSCKEGELVKRIWKEMEQLHFDEIRVDGFGNIIGRIGNGPRIIAMDAHIDTVDVGNASLWDFDPFCGDIRDGFVWGRGASDQEGGMASLVYAGGLIKKYNLLPDDVTLLIVGSVSEEDCDGLCWRYLIEKECVKPEVCIITEPTDGKLYRGQRGRMEITASIQGLSAHGSAPERGINAIIKMADIIKGVEKLGDRLAFDEFLGKGSVTISRISSSAPSLCSVADACEIYLDRRLTWGETPEMAIREIEALDPTGSLKVIIPEYTEPTHTGCVYPVEKIFPAWKTPEEHPAVVSGVQTFENLFGKAPIVDRWTFSTNGVAISGTHGIPCVGFGPGKEEWAHAPNERVAVSQLVDAALFYARFPEIYINQTEGR